MAMSKGKRMALAALGGVVLLVVLALVALYVAQREVKSRVVQALAPIGSAERIDVGLTEVKLVNVQLKAPADWPTPYSLHADTITLVPDLRDLLARRMHIRSVTVQGFDLPLVRSAGGRLEILPNLRDSLKQTTSASGGPGGGPEMPREKQIDSVVFQQGVFNFYDRSVSNPPYHIAVKNAQAKVGPLHLPDLTDPTNLDVTGSIAGPQHTGTVSFSGWIVISSKDSQTTTNLQGVDIATLDPYLLKKAGAHAQVKSGTVDLHVTSTVRNYQLHAPGTVTLHNLQLDSSGNPVDTFLSIPTQAIVAALKHHNGNITLHFELDGNLRDPKFSVNESLLTKIGAGLAGALGVSVEGVANGVNDTVKGLGNALKNLLGK